MDISEATLVLEYAANHIDGDNRRGVFIKALVEGEEWAETDFKNWCEQTTQEGAAPIRVKMHAKGF